MDKQDELDLTELEKAVIYIEKAKTMDQADLARSRTVAKAIHHLNNEMKIIQDLNR